MKNVSSTPGNDKTVFIVFSKDRAMQLDALLRSYLHFVTNPISVKVLYHASSEEFMNAYISLMEIYKNESIEFIQESRFKPDLIHLFNELSCSKVIFLVDDLLFKETLDLKKFTTLDPKKHVASLRLGNHLTYAYTLQQNQALPAFTKAANLPNLLSWNWKNEQGDWAYPLSVDGHLFDKNELQVLINILEYKAPNSFEEALQLVHPIYVKRSGLCFPNSIIVNNPCNKVQTENDNTFGEIGIDELNKNGWTDSELILKSSKV